MTDRGSPPAGRLRLLATFVAKRAVEVAEAAPGNPAHTNGQVIFVSAAGTESERRREVLLQSALLGAGSLGAPVMKALRARPSVARRYLALEGRRVIAELAEHLPLAATLPAEVDACTTSRLESLDIARGRTKVAAAPPWFGVLRPSLLLRAGPAVGVGADGPLQRETVDAIDDGLAAEGDGSRIRKLFENPAMTSSALARFLRELFGDSRSSGDSAAGAETGVASARRTHAGGPNATPLPTPIRFADDTQTGRAIGVGGALLPEWDVHRGQYRPDWCRVVDFPLTVPADVAASATGRDDVLRRRLSRIGLELKVLRRRADGDDLDIESLIDLFVDLRSGHSPGEHVHLERRKLARNLGVLILIDSSGSATDTDAVGLAVHEHQRRAAATIGVTLEELGDRVAVYAFRSQGRRDVRLMAIKTFSQRFGAAARARLNQLQPTGYTRLGAAVRGAGRLLESQAGTSNRLLLLLSDGFPYDRDYEGRYAEADTGKALDEVRAKGIACLCLSLGSTTHSEALRRVFGSAAHACAATLAEVSPRMDELFLTSLRQLAAARPS